MMKRIIAALTIALCGCDGVAQPGCHEEARVMGSDSSVYVRTVCDVGATLSINVIGNQTIATCSCTKSAPDAGALPVEK